MPFSALTSIIALFPRFSARKRNISTAMMGVGHPSDGPRAESLMSRRRYQTGQEITNSRAALSMTKLSRGKRAFSQAPVGVLRARRKCCPQAGWRNSSRRIHCPSQSPERALEVARACAATRTVQPALIPIRPTNRPFTARLDARLYPLMALARPFLLHIVTRA